MNNWLITSVFAWNLKSSHFSILFKKEKCFWKKKNPKRFEIWKKTENQKRFDNRRVKPRKKFLKKHIFTKSQHSFPFEFSIHFSFCIVVVHHFLSCETCFFHFFQIFRKKPPSTKLDVFPHCIIVSVFALWKIMFILISFSSTYDRPTMDSVA